MADIQREIDELRYFMDSDEQQASERVRRAAAAYATACHEANRRLSRCAELINRGLRGEAIHLAQIDPPLLDLTGQLNFPGCDEFIEVATSYKLAAPPRLALKHAEELNRAYSQEEPLKELMKTHRLLSLSRANLRTRLDILRQIAELDHLNPIWDDDVRAYEKVRLKEIRQDVEAAIKANDEKRLFELQDEIDADGWRESVPADLASKISDRSKAIERERLERLFATFEDALNEAVATVDLKAAKECREQIESAARKERLEDDDSLLARLRPGLDWLDRKEKAAARQRIFNSALDQFEADIRTNRPFSELQEQFRELYELDDGVPAEVERAYRDLERRQRRSRTIKRVLITLTILLIAGGSGVGRIMWLKEQAFNKKVDEARGKLDALMSAESYAELRGYIEDLSDRDPKVAAAVDVRSFTRRLDEVDKVKQDRTKGFAEALRKAEELPFGDPFEQATINQLKFLASTTSEKASAALYAEKREAVRKKQDHKAKDVAQNALHDQLAGLQNELQTVRLETYDKQQLDVSHRALVDLKKRLQQFDSEAANLSPVLKDAAENIRGKIAKAEQALEQSSKEIDALDTITRSLKSNAENMDAHRAVLVEAAKSFADPERRKKFEATAREFQAWAMVIAWDKALVESRTDYLLLKDAMKADARAKDINAFSDRFSEELQNEGSPVSSILLLDYIFSLKATASRDKFAEDGRALFTREDVRGLHMLRSVDGKIYYLKDNPDDQVKKAMKTGGTTAFIRYRSVGTTADRYMKLADYESHETAPQSELADKVLIDLRHIDEIGFDAFVVKVIDEKIRQSKNLDPILAIIMIRKLMEAASSVDTALAHELLKPTKILEDALKGGIDLNVPWTDPDRADAKRVRDGAAKFLSSFPSLKSVPAAAQKRRMELEKQLKQSRYQVLGWLHRIPGASWKVVVVKPLKPNGEMKVVTFKDDKPSGWETIGKVNNGLPFLDPESPGTLVEGRLVFVPTQ